MKFFTQYCPNEQWFYEQSLLENNPQAQLLNHTASSMFRRRGVSAGDHLYIVTVLSGCLYLAGKMEIGEIVSFEEASRRLNDKNLFKASDHLLASRVTALDYMRNVPWQITVRLRFFRGRRLASLKFTKPGQLDTQTLRGIRQMPEETARTLDNLLPPLKDCYK
jgi:hypothetical protein